MVLKCIVEKLHMSIEGPQKACGMYVVHQRREMVPNGVTENVLHLRGLSESDSLTLNVDFVLFASNLLPFLADAGHQPDFNGCPCVTLPFNCNYTLGGPEFILLEY